MRTSSRIFAALFLALGIFCIGAVIYGATHQVYTAGICLAMALVLMADATREIEKIDKNNPLN